METPRDESPNTPIGRRPPLRFRAARRSRTSPHVNGSVLETPAETRSKGGKRNQPSKQASRHPTSIQALSKPALASLEACQTSQPRSKGSPCPEKTISLKGKYQMRSTQVHGGSKNPGNLKMACPWQVEKTWKPKPAVCPLRFILCSFEPHFRGQPKESPRRASKEALPRDPVGFRRLPRRRFPVGFIFVSLKPLGW